MLHHPPGQGGIEWRQGQRAVLENLDKLAAGAEEEDRAELRIETAADDQLIAVQVDHGLDADAQEMFGAGTLATDVSMARKAVRTASACSG